MCVCVCLVTCGILLFCNIDDVYGCMNVRSWVHMVGKY